MFRMRHKVKEGTKMPSFESWRTKSDSRTNSRCKNRQTRWRHQYYNATYWPRYYCVMAWFITAGKILKKLDGCAKNANIGIRTVFFYFRLMPCHAKSVRLGFHFYILYSHLHFSCPSAVLRVQIRTFK